MRNEPKLRFKEFNYKYKNDDLGVFIKYITEKTNLCIGDLYVSTENIYKDFNGLSPVSLLTSIRANKVSEKNILFSNIRPYLKKLDIAGFNGGCSSDVLCFDTNFNDNKYFKYLMQNNKFINYVKDTSKGTKMPRGDKESILKYNVCIPNILEQNKIGNFISKIDTKIDLMQSKQENLKLFKKGLIQNEFTFNKNKEIKLEKLIIEYSKRNRELEVKRVLSVTNSRGFITQDEMFDRSVASFDISTYKIVKKGQFGYNPSRINVGSIDLLTTFDEGVLSPIYVIFYCNGNKLDSQYLKYWFESHNFRGNMKKYIEGGVRDTLSFTNLSSMKMPLPSVEEQVKFNKSMNPITHKIEMLEHYTIILKQFNIPHPIKLKYNMVIFTKEVKK